jgi:O-acetyl-ADP-ribose deacetylase (regulator of RNase III)
MIHYNTGDLLDVEEGAIIHGCNAQGVMGSGVALAIKTKYPKAYESYKKFEEKHELRLASVSMIAVHNDTPHKFWVCNVITQEFYGTDPKVQYVSYGAIHLGFEKLHKHFPLATPFHFPKIGAGRGNGDWKIISNLIELACPSRDLTCWQN